MEIVADRGIDKPIGYDRWDVICHEIEVLFRRGDLKRVCYKALQKSMRHWKHTFQLRVLKTKVNVAYNAKK
ncbi:MAG: putative membrane protein [Methylophilaceae bacterium]